MSDHLDELRRQRTLVAGHLAWLDAEIAAASIAHYPAAPFPSVAPSSLVGHGDNPSTTDTFSLPLPAPADVGQDARRGCLRAAVVALACLFALLAAIWLLFYSDRPLLFSSPPDSSPATSPAGKTSGAPKALPSSPRPRGGP